MGQLLGQIYQKHRQGLFTLALSVTGDVEQAEDAVHEAFARLCRRGMPQVGDPLAYVFRSVRNAALDQVRKRKTRLRSADSIFEPTLSAPAESQSAALEQAEQKRLIEQALAGLPEQQRQVVVMRIYAGLTFRQIAEALDQPLSTVASRYQRALSALEKSLEPLL